MTKHIITAIILGLLGWRIFSATLGESKSEFPNQPIQIVVPYSAGGGSDTFARIFQKSLAKNESLGVPIVIINRPGGSATIGSRFVKDSRPDGYRLLCHHEGIIATKLAGTVPFGPEAFEPVAQTGAKILLMIVRADSPYQSLPDLLDAAQQEPNKIRVGANQGSPAWFICKQMLAEYPGAEFNFIPADGSKRLSYLLGNKLEAGVFSLDEYMANRNSDDAPLSENIAAIANFSRTRHTDIEDVSTSTEQGLQTHAENAYYFWAPKKTPPEIVQHLASAFNDAMNDQEVLGELERLSIPPVFRSGQQLNEHLAERVSAFEGIAVKVNPKLPNFPAWMIGIVGALATIVIVTGLFERQSSGGAEKPLAAARLPSIGQDEVPQVGQRKSLDEIPVESDLGNSLNPIGLVCVGLLAGYVLLLQLEIPFAISSTIAIFLLGATIAHWDRKWLFSIAQMALLVALGIELVFTKIFTVPLP